MKFYWRWEKVCRPWASYQHLPAPYSQWHGIVNVTVGCKNYCIMSKMKKTHLIWESIHVIDIQKKEYWAQHRSLWNTQCNVWHKELQFLIKTYCFLLRRWYTAQQEAYSLDLLPQQFQGDKPATWYIAILHGGNTGTVGDSSVAVCIEFGCWCVEQHHKLL